MATLLSILVGALVLVLVLWVLNLILARLNLPADVIQIIHVIVALVVIVVVLGWLFGALPGISSIAITRP